MQIPDFPKKVGETTAKRFLHELGFERRNTSRKSVYIDGHEREDVKAYREVYVAKLQSLERDHTVPPLPSDAVVDAPQPGFIGRPEAEKHLVTIYHDETTFQSNEDQKWAWGQVFLEEKRKRLRRHGI